MQPGRPYAIISHRWTDEEVSFEDFFRDFNKYVGKGPNGHYIKRLGQTVPYGWTKIFQACKISRAEGYGWVWLDSCCIDRRSSAELSEAINSMFDWYRRAEVCYEFLRDVQCLASEEGMPFETQNYTGLHKFDDKEFLKSEWFRRGWYIITSVPDPYI